jgi:hypothetical protein
VRNASRQPSAFSHQPCRGGLSVDVTAVDQSQTSPLQN